MKSAAAHYLARRQRPHRVAPLRQSERACPPGLDGGGDRSLRGKGREKEDGPILADTKIGTVPASTKIGTVPVDAGADVVILDAAGNVRGLQADRVIFAAPQFVAQHVIRDYRRAPPAHLDEFQYVPWLVANLFLRDRPAGLGFPLCWDNVLYESRSLGYVVATHQTGPDYGPTVLTYYHAFADGPPREVRAELLNMDWSDCADFVVSDLERAHREIGRLVERIDVVRWGHAMVRPRPGFLWSGARQKAAQPYRGIHFANTDLSGVALLEEAFYHGLRAADEVLAARRPLHA